MPTTQRDGTGWEERARRAATDCEAKRQVYNAALELRDDLILEGINTGRSYATVAATCLVSQGRVHQVLARRA